MAPQNLQCPSNKTEGNWCPPSSCTPPKCPPNPCSPSKTEVVLGHTEELPFPGGDVEGNIHRVPLPSAPASQQEGLQAIQCCLAAEGADTIPQDPTGPRGVGLELIEYTFCITLPIFHFYIYTCIPYSG